MSKTFSFEKVTDITPELLHDNNISLLMMDLDNTIAPYHIHEPSDEILSWSEAMKSEGITLFFVSNSHVSGRVEHFSEIMGISYITNSHKPSPVSVRKVLGTLNIKCENAALVGDQIFTDVQCAKLSDITGLLVRPVTFEPYSLPNILRLLRYFIEAPFRLLCANKMWRNTRHG